MLNLLKDLSNSYGVSGFEDDVVDVVKNYTKDFQLEVDTMMNIFIKNKNNDNDLTIMLDAHLDEVGFMVQFIDDKGLIRFIPLGGWVVNNVPAQLVMVKNSEGKYIKGIVSSKPPHFMSEEEKNKKLEISDLTIDIGATSREEVINDFKIEIGAPIVPFVEFNYNEDNGTMMGKAFDNRLGCGAVIETMNRLKKENININVVGALATQEEVGTRGAVLTARKVKPDFAIVFEGSPADDTFSNEHFIQCGLNRGPQIRYRDSSYVSNHRFISFARMIAEKNNIPYQNAVRASGGTDAGPIHLSNEGVPTLVLGIPSRYVHTHHGYANISDFENTVNLACEIIKNINSEIFKI